MINILVSQNLVSSKAEAKRLMIQNAIKIDGKICNDLAHVLKKGCGELVIKVGKRRFLRVLS
jgi:tyrosyl-tRNA synthetase